MAGIGRPKVLVGEYRGNMVRGGQDSSLHATPCSKGQDFEIDPLCYR